ncbi:MAG: DUF418 domain-containing transporter [Nannocystaceae bacterium]
MSAPASDRLLALDALRGVAVFLMMEQHMGVWLWSGANHGGAPTALVAFNALGGAAAPLFVTLAGVGTSLSLRRPGRGDALLIRRGLTILAFGYLLSWATPSWFTLRSWFVLHMMGAAMALAPIWRRLGERALLALAALVLAVTPALQHWLDTPSLSNDRMALKPPFDHLAGGHLRVALVEGQFPVFPWLTMFLVGVVVGRWLAAGEVAKVRRLALIVLSLGTGLALLGGALPELGVPRTPLLQRIVGVPLGFFPATVAILALLQGVVLWLVTLAAAIEARSPLRADGPLVCLGRVSLTLLLVHVVVFRELSRDVGLWRGLDAPATLAVIGLWTILCAVIARVWRRSGYRFGAEWLLRTIAG